MKQNRMKKWMASLLLLGVVLLMGCVEKDYPVVANVEVVMPEGMNVMELQPYQYDFELSITSDTEWTITTEGGVCRTYPHSGSGNATVKVRVNANTTGQERVGTIDILFPKAKPNDQHLAVRQLPYITISQDDQTDINKSQSVGYGYNIYTGEVKPAIANLEALDKASLLSISNGKTDMIYKSFTGSSVHELSSKLSTEMGLKASYFGFTTEIKTSFGAEALQSQSSEYAITYFYMDKYTKSIDLAIRRLCSSTTYMNEFAYEDLNGKGAGAELYPSNDKGFHDLLEDYGTHFIRKAHLGARLSRSMSVDVTKVSGNCDIAAFAKQSYGDSILSDTYAQVEAEYKESYQKNTNACEKRHSVLGGDDKLSSSFYNSNDKSDFDNWIKSVDRNNARPVIYGDGDLYPLYELVADQDRREALRKYMDSNKFKQDFQSVDITYDYNVPSEIDIPAFGDDDNLIKEVTADGQSIALICNEYMPAINKEKRVTVVYPVVNNKTLWNVGYFIGSNGQPPAKVCTQRGVINITSLKDDNGNSLIPGARTKLFIRGSAISDSYLTDSIKGQEIKPYPAKVNDYVVKENVGPIYKGKGDYNYGIVKIFDKLWLTYNLRKSDADINGKPFVVAHDRKNYFYKLSTIDSTRIYSLIEGWRLPSKADYNSIRTTLSDNKISNIANTFYKGKDGLLGFNIIPLEATNKYDLEQYSIWNLYSRDGTDGNKIGYEVGIEYFPEYNEASMNIPYDGSYFGCIDGIFCINSRMSICGDWTPQKGTWKDYWTQIRLCTDI